MADVTAVLTAFRAELDAAGLVRRPSTDDVARPPLIVEPLEGPPAPGDDLGDGLYGDPELVLSLLHSGELTPSSGYSAATERVYTVDVRYRSKTAAALRRAEALDTAIRDRLIRPETNYGYGFILAEGTAAALLVTMVGVFGGFGPISRSRAAGYDHVAKYAVGVAP
jgi:hypothetical protein